MRRGIAFLGLAFCLFVMSSCAGVGTIVTITAFGVVGYEEVRIHRPDLKLEPINNLQLPDLKFFSEQSSDQNNTKTKPSGALSTFGFNCSNLDDEKKQSKCFDNFSKALAQEEEEYNKQKGAVTSRKKENTTNKPQKVAKALKPLSSKPVKNLPSSPQKNTPKTNKSDALENLTSYIENWASAWEKQDVASYLSFYSKEFKGSKNHRGAWEASRQRALRKNKNVSIRLSQIQIHEKGKEKIEVNFIQKYKSDGYTDTGIKELLLEKKGTRWKIIKETWMPADALTKKKQPGAQIKQAKAMLASWLEAWISQDVNAYLSFYSDKFKGPENNRKKWRNSRHRALKANKNLSIQVSNLQIAQSEKTIELNFRQEFNSKKYSDVGIKELVWTKNGNDWKILKETWISS